ncbi:hypothetical protein TNCV_4380841 [Trichonephila clavipes]|nr:hypothetical protein TNCV_4380841 [Trichonephila clavipes]
MHVITSSLFLEALHQIDSVTGTFYHSSWRYCNSSGADASGGLRLRVERSKIDHNGIEAGKQGLHHMMKMTRKHLSILLPSNPSFLNSIGSAADYVTAAHIITDSPLCLTFRKRHSRS